MYFILIIRFAIKNREKYRNAMTVSKAIRLMLKGAHSIRNNKDQDQVDDRIQL